MNTEITWNTKSKRYKEKSYHAVEEVKSLNRMKVVSNHGIVHGTRQCLLGRDPPIKKRTYSSMIMVVELGLKR